MDVLGAGVIHKSDMVTMKGDGISLATPGQSNGVVGGNTMVGRNGGNGSCNSSSTTGGIIDENSKTTVFNNGNSAQTLDCHSNGTPTTNGDRHWKVLPQDSSKMNKIRDIVESSASVMSKNLVDNLIQQVGQLTDVEKFLLYLRLPVGRPAESDPLKQPLNPLGSRCEIQLTINWIKTHLEMNSEVSLPKREVYNEYMDYCKINSVKPLSTADFGKVMKQVFPGVRPRRLGQRGASKYCYSGLRKRWTLNPPDLPDLNDNMAKKTMLGVDCVVDETEVERAAGCLVMEWAEKLCSVKFDCIKDLALHLVHKNYVDNRSVAAFTLLSVADQKQDVIMGPGANGGKHRETQIQLQRKLHEREQIREQKRKLQEQQPNLNKCANERPKSRRRSATSRNPSGETVPNGIGIATPINTTTTTTTKPSIVTGITINSNMSTVSTTITAASTPTTTNGNCDSVTIPELPNGASTTKDILSGSGSNNSVFDVTAIKQEQPFKQENHLDFIDHFSEKTLDNRSIMNDKNDNFNNNIITNVSHSHPLGKKSCSSNNIVSNFSPQPSKPIVNKVAISKPNASKKPFLMLPTSNSKTSPKSRFKAIQPRVSEGFQGLVSGGSQWSDQQTVNMEDNNSTITETTYLGMSTVSDTISQNVSKGQQIIGNINNNNIISVSNCNNTVTNNHEGGEEEYMLSELRKLLQKGLPKENVTQGGNAGGVSRSLLADSDMMDPESSGAGGMGRHVSFQQPQGGDILTPLMGGQTVGSVPPSPNTRRPQFFTPICNSNVDQVQGVSQCSSTNASPFMSPCNTPLPRSRHNSGQTNSTYVTPRSTPLTPEHGNINLNYPNTSEGSTPFMSPAATPIFPRSRHNSSQNLRTAYTPNCRSRHSSGAPTFRHNPYATEELTNRRGGKFRSRHSSGSVPPSPSSAPLSPLVQDPSINPSQENVNGQFPSMLHNMLKAKQSVTGYSDLRRRHMSAGPTIHYQPQPPAFQPDPLAQEVNALTNCQAGPSTVPPTSSSNRPQSVPLLQMLNMPCNIQDSFAKSHPNTPIVNQSFTFSDYCNSQPSSYAPTPVPSEYNDFTENYPLDSVDPLLDANLPNDSGCGSSSGLEDALTVSGSHSSDLSTLTDPMQVPGPPNVTLFSTDYQTDCISSRQLVNSRNDSSVLDSIDCLGHSLVNPHNNNSEMLIGTPSNLTLNALNRMAIEGGTGGLEDDFQPTLADLGDQEVFNSLVSDVNKE